MDESPALFLARHGETDDNREPLRVQGFTDTPLIERAIETIVAKTGRSAAQARASLVRSNPQGRLVAPEEVADAVAWLASPAAGAITGQAIVVAGGEVMAG